MGLSHLAWFEGVVSASESLDKAYDFITGGPLTETLVAVGDAHATSAKDHLVQALKSNAPRERLLQAAGELQAAFHLYEQSLNRGVQVLRRFMPGSDLATTRIKTIGCASSIVLIQWYLAEAPANRREWLDRTRMYLKAYEDDRDASLAVLWFRNSYEDSNFQWEMNHLAHAYLTLEENVLPAELVRPRPLPFVPVGELQAMGIKFDYKRLNRDELRKHRWERVST